jgi:hypothetical protein
MPEEWVDIKDKTDNTKALPEPRKVKHEMMVWRRRTHEAAREFSVHSHGKNYNRWRKCLIEWYLNMEPYIHDFEGGQHDYSELRQIENWASGERPHQKDLWQKTQKLNTLMKDMGVINIGVKREGYPPGYEFLKGMPHEMDTSDAAYERLLQNVRNQARLLEKDTDGVGVIWGPNRTGKTTLALHIMDEMNSVHDIEIDESNIIMTEDQFWEATDKNPQYSTSEIDELSSVFYAKDAMKSDQKKRKKKMKTFATDNQFLVGCDTSFYNIDKEIISDKVKWGIRVPKRGRFEFYSGEKIEQFEKDADDGSTVTPQPDFAGSFPKKVDELWEMYIEVEDQKVVSGDEDDGPSNEEIIEKVKDDTDRYLKKYRGREMMNQPLVENDFDIGGRRARQIKAAVEEDLGINQDDDD